MGGGRGTLTGRSAGEPVPPTLSAKQGQQKAPLLSPKHPSPGWCPPPSKDRPVMAYEQQEWHESGGLPPQYCHGDRTEQAHWG